MAQHETHKSGYAGKVATLNRRAVRRGKYATHALDITALLSTLPLTH